jgi:arginine exporter protein ArgO
MFFSISPIFIFLYFFFYYSKWNKTRKHKNNSIESDRKIISKAIILSILNTQAIIFWLFILGILKFQYEFFPKNQIEILHSYIGVFSGTFFSILSFVLISGRFVNNSEKIDYLLSFVFFILALFTIYKNI